MVVDDKQDIIDELRGTEYETKVIFTIDGVEHEAEIQIYGGDVESKVIDFCLTPKVDN